jgi:hypothetical protein
VLHLSVQRFLSVPRLSVAIRHRICVATSQRTPLLLPLLLLRLLPL